MLSCTRVCSIMQWQACGKQFTKILRARAWRALPSTFKFQPPFSKVWWSTPRFKRTTLIFKARRSTCASTCVWRRPSTYFIGWRASRTCLLRCFQRSATKLLFTLDRPSKRVGCATSLSSMNKIGLPRFCSTTKSTTLHVPISGRRKAELTLTIRRQRGVAWRSPSAKWLYTCSSKLSLWLSTWAPRTNSTSINSV